jgi:putative SOS response-associated peptidase YedK
MCGRFSVNKEQVENWVLDTWDIPYSCDSNLDLRPTQNIAALTYNNGRLSQLNTTWGIKPSWSKRLLINAQAETASTKVTFKDSFAIRRCIIPFSAWYEWKKQGVTKQKYAFTSVDKQPLLMAGIWFEAEDVPQIVTLTNRPTVQCATIHKRMPLLIKSSEVEFWFNSTTKSLLPLIEPNEQQSFVITAN